MRALSNGRFVGADLNSDKQLTTWATEIQGWETFTLYLTPESPAANVIRYGDTFALRAYNNAYVSYISTGDGRLLATASQIQTWETFVFIDPARP